MFRLGIAQVPSDGTLSENMKQIACFAAAAAQEGCSAVCFPECGLTGYDPENAVQKAIPRSHDSILQLSALASELRIDLLIGFMERDSDSLYITHGILRPDGTMDFYRKTHLGQKESRFFQPGDHLETFSLSCGLQAGFQLCVETHFPEITQSLTLQGAQVIFAPHAVPAVSGDRQKIWGKYIPARSYDNRVYFACCNQTDQVRFGGGCLVTDPDGEVLASDFTAVPALIAFEVEPELVAVYRDGGPGRRYRFFPLVRRPELY